MLSLRTDSYLFIVIIKPQQLFTETYTNYIIKIMVTASYRAVFTIYELPGQYCETLPIALFAS